MLTRAVRQSLPQADGVVDLAVDEPAAEPAEDTREYRKLYETELHPLPVEERMALAGQVTGARLFALCFDVDPKVIVALFESSAANVEHARLVALHHRTAHGLNELVRRAALLSDPLVNRRLVRNPAVDEGLFRRLMANKRLLEVHKTSLDHDVPERSRAAARTVFRSKWATAQSEEKVEIVWATEGGSSSPWPASPSTAAPPRSSAPGPTSPSCSSRTWRASPPRRRRSSGTSSASPW